MSAAPRRTWFATLALVAAIPSGIAAHDFWIEPSAYTVKLGDPVRVHLRVGHSFGGEAVPRDDRRIERFVLAGPGGETKVLGRHGMDPAGLFRLDAPGIWFVGYRSTPSPHDMAPAAFEAYLREEGLERIVEDRAVRSESQKNGRERFSRSVKSLLRTADAVAGQGYDRALGFTLEFVLEADPVAAPGGRVPMRLLYEGKPLAGALVVVVRKAGGAAGKEAMRGRTDEDGRFMMPAGGGTWLVTSVHMTRAAEGRDYEWDSVWTSLTFQVP